LSLNAELERLFGKPTVTQAGLIDPAQVDAQSVREVVAQLIELRGKPSEQMAYIGTLNPFLAAAVCRWLGDPAFWGLVADITMH